MQNAVKLRDYLNLPSDENPWLLKPLIPVGGLCNLYGAPKAMKSFMSLQLACALAEGKPFLGIEPSREGVRVLYVQLDTPRSIWQGRIKDLEAAGEVFGPKADENLILADPEQAPYPFDILHPTSFTWLKDQVTLHTPALVIVDVLRKIFRGNEDKSEVMAHVLGTLKLACLPAAVLFVSHARKTNPEFDGGTLQENRGASSIPGDCDTIMRLTKASPKGKKPATLSWSGRACEDQDLQVQLRKSLFFDVLSAPEKDRFHLHLEEVLADNTLKTTYAKAKALAEISGAAFEKCKSAINRVEV